MLGRVVSRADERAGLAHLAVRTCRLASRAVDPKRPSREPLVLRCAAWIAHGIAHTKALLRAP